MVPTRRILGVLRWVWMDNTVRGVHCRAIDIPSSHRGVNGEYNVLFPGSVTGSPSRKISQCCRECNSPNPSSSRLKLIAQLNILRCWLGAGGSAVTQPMLTKLNAGWTYTLLALLCSATSTPLILAERRWGMKWRGEREEKLRKKKLAKQQAAEICRGNGGDRGH